MTALRALAQDLGDPFNASQPRVEAALFGPGAYAFAILAQEANAPLGIALCHPIFSTFQGTTCTYVSDLWVAPKARGQGLGQALLAKAATEGAARWHSQALRLTVYADNAPAIAFYHRLGFEIRTSDQAAALRGAALDALVAGARCGFK